MLEIPPTVIADIPAERVVEAAALLLQTAEFLDLSGVETPLGDDARRAAGELLGAANGQNGRDEAFWTDPLTVEAHARAYERIADVVERGEFRQRAEDVRARHHAMWDCFQPVRA